MKTCRGFIRNEFTDCYGAVCSIQESSSGMESRIWLGPNNADPKFLVKDKGWLPYPFPAEVMFNTRMHLNKDMAKELVKHLNHFIETGELPE